MRHRQRLRVAQLNSRIASFLVVLQMLEKLRGMRPGGTLNKTLRRDGREAEGGGLLNIPALFVPTIVRIFC